jgi:hypothetical protein
MTAPSWRSESREKDPRLKPAHVRLLAHLIKVRMNKYGDDAWPHQQTIASGMKMRSRQRVNRLITDLVAFGYLWLDAQREPALKRHGTRAKVITFYVPSQTMLYGSRPSPGSAAEVAPAAGPRPQRASELIP